MDLCSWTQNLAIAAPHFGQLFNPQIYDIYWITLPVKNCLFLYVIDNIFFYKFFPLTNRGYYFVILLFSFQSLIIPRISQNQIPQQRCKCYLVCVLIWDSFKTIFHLKWKMQMCNDFNFSYVWIFFSFNLHSKNKFNVFFIIIYIDQRLCQHSMWYSGWRRKKSQWESFMETKWYRSLSWDRLNIDFFHVFRSSV